MKNIPLADFIKKLPLFMLPIPLFTTFVKDKSNPLYVSFMVGLATLSIMALVYRTKTENGKEFVAPKKYMALMVMIGLTVFAEFTLGLPAWVCKNVYRYKRKQSRLWQDCFFI